MLSESYLRIPLEQINVSTTRQRRSVDTSDLLLSIRLRGVIQPIVVERSAEDHTRFDLIAGERRYQASRELGLADIPARLADQLSRVEREIIELEENVKRRDLAWQDEALAMERIHKLHCELDSSWTMTKTGEYAGFTQAWVSICLAVAEEIRAENKNVLASSSIKGAYNLIARKTGRAIDDAMADLLGEHMAPVETAYAGVNRSDPINSNSHPGSGPNNERPDAQINPVPARTETILNVSFLEFAPLYSGPPFNFIHCDFPYGINHHTSDQGGSDRLGSYDDSPEVYWALCACLAKHSSRLMAPSSHLMFWLSCDIERQHETLEFFRREAPGLVFRTVPIYWHKTDNRGILPDPNRGPRQIVETALLASRGDRKIIRAVSNAYGSPTTKEVHQSEKSEPMLRHFFGMFVDENTRLLDPTCGSGSAIRAAESLGAGYTLGLEINPDYCDAARSALRKARTLRELT